jgi:hypothetical protein
MTPSEPGHSLLLVLSANHAIKGEAALNRAGIPCSLIPVPRTLSSQCGVCLQVSLDDRERATEVLETAGLQISAVHNLKTRRARKEKAYERSNTER